MFSPFQLKKKMLYGNWLREALAADVGDKRFGTSPPPPRSPQPSLTRCPNTDLWRRGGSLCRTETMGLM